MNNTLDTSLNTEEVYLWQSIPHTNHVNSYAYDLIKESIEKNLVPAIQGMSEFRTSYGYCFVNHYIFHHEEGVSGILQSKIFHGKRDVIYMKGKPEALKVARKDIEYILSEIGKAFEEIPENERRHCIK